MADKQNKISPLPPRGMKDHLPDEVLPRLEVIDKLRRIFELYGFLPLETPAMERLEVLMGKYGEEGDKLIFKVMKRGEELSRALEEVKNEMSTPLNETSDRQSTLVQLVNRAASDLGLRYDLTVSLARVVAQYGEQLPKPFKRYQIAPVWRADRPQRGRFREFIQCDVDIVGSDSLVADAEIIGLLVDAYRELGFDDCEVLVNHRGLLKAFNAVCGNQPDRFVDFCIAIDKLDKIDRAGVAAEMRERGLATEKLGRFWELADGKCHIDDKTGLSTLLQSTRNFVGQDGEGAESLNQLEALFNLLNNLGVAEGSVTFDPTLARGLDYYTGPVFEVVCKDRSIGSLGGGGRYNELVGMFSNHSIPAVGTSFGLDRIVEALVAKGRLKSRRTTLEVEIIDLVGTDISAAYCGQLLRALRQKRVSCDLGYDRGSKPGKQLKSADRKNVPFVFIVGDEEIDTSLVKESDETFVAGAAVTVKRLSDGLQKTLSLTEAVNWVKKPERD